MSRDLGFRILDVHKQFILPVAEVDPGQLDEVRAELAFDDLVRTDEADETVVQVLSGTLRGSAPGNADRWREHGPPLVEHFDELRDDALDAQTREDVVNDLREEAAALPDALGGW